MILYGMGDPVEALGRLAPRVLQVHNKDARRTSRPGTWGEELPVGRGEVDWTSFLRVLRERCPSADWIIERESGTSRIEDVRVARALLTSPA
jgi:sugar phosphate isomerase/epimerase